MPPAAPPLSIWDLFQHADFVVKFVMIGLLIASVAVWAIVLDKFVLYARTRRAMAMLADSPGESIPIRLINAGFDLSILIVKSRPYFGRVP